MRNKLTFILFGLLIAVGWTNALAQQQPTQNLAERLTLSVADYQSTYDADAQTNTYTNTLQLSQPTGDYKLTAGMLNEGNNYITIHRLDNTGGDVECARVNLNTEVIEQETEVIDMIDFYGDGSNAPSSNYTITANDLADSNWGTNGSNLILQTSGYAYISGQGGLTYTVPDGYSNASFQFIIYVGSNARGGYFTFNDGTGWSIGSQATANGVAAFVVAGLNSGDVISLYGGVYDSGYYIYQSPDIELIGVLDYPTTLVPDVQVTPAVSTWDGSAWSNETALGTTTTYTPNDNINLNALGNLNDIFSVNTSTNSHPDSYSYKADLDANILLPSSGTGSSFTATADFTTATSSDPSTAAFTGPGEWEFLGAEVYSPSAGTCCYIEYFGSMLFVLPNDFMGNSVSVTVTTSTGSDGAGYILVNGISHSFTAGSTYTWTVPVTANGVIEFKSNGTTYSADFTQITISGGSGAKNEAPRQDNSQRPVIKSLEKSLKPGKVLPLAKSKKETCKSIIVND